MVELKTSEEACCSTPLLDVEHTARGANVSVISDNDYLVKAEGASKALIFFYDIGGLRPAIHQAADHLSTETGFHVIVPDFFRGEKCPMPGPGSSVTPAMINVWIERHGNYEGRVRDDTVRVVRWLKEKFGVDSVGAIGLCWGGKVIFKIGAEDRSEEAFSAVRAVAAGHPAWLKVEDGEGVKIPVCLMPSKSEDKELMEALWNAMDPAVIEKSVHKRFDDVGHGFMASRDLGKNELVRQRASEAYNIAATFFKSIL